MIFGLCQEIIYLHRRWTKSPNFTRREEESFPISTEIQLTSPELTHTNLDVKQERRIDDYLNIDGSRDMSDYWTCFTQYYSIGRKTVQTDICGPGRDWQEKQLTSRPYHLWTELWTRKVGRNAKLKERQKWSHEKLQLDNARKFRGYFSLISGPGIQRGPSRMLARNRKHQWFPAMYLQDEQEQSEFRDSW